MFAGLKVDGHIDVRAPGVYNPYAVELTGQIKIPTDGEYTIQIQARSGEAVLRIGDNKQVAMTKKKVATPLKLKAGTYPITIQYFWSGVFNDLNIQYTGPETTELEPFEKLVVPLEDTKTDAPKKD